MDGQIVVWDRDPSFRQALFRSLLGLGYNPVSLDSPVRLRRAVELLEPELMLLEGEWPRGELVEFGQEQQSPGRAEEMAVVLPLLRTQRVGRGAPDRGIVLDNLRKPFPLPMLLNTIRRSLKTRSWLRWEPSFSEQCLEVRPLTEGAELREAYHLRYQVYREVGYIPPSPEELEIDHYDRRSIIFGAFVREGGQRRMAGTVRIIRRPEGRTRVEDRSLPATDSFGLSWKDFCRLHRGFGSRCSFSGRAVSPEVCELSRLAILPEFRRHPLGIERRLFELIVVDSCSQGPPRNWFMIAIHPSRKRKFQRFGFRQVPGLGVRDYKDLSQPAILLSLDLQEYLLGPNPFTGDLHLNSLYYRINGRLLVHAEESVLDREPALV